MPSFRVLVSTSLKSPTLKWMETWFFWTFNSPHCKMLLYCRTCTYKTLSLPITTNHTHKRLKEKLDNICNQHSVHVYQALDLFILSMVFSAVISLADLLFACKRNSIYQTLSTGLFKTVFYTKLTFQSSLFSHRLGTNWQQYFRTTRWVYCPQIR